MKQDLIAILDLGSEDNSRLARRVRALGVYSEIYPHDITAQELMQENLKGIILNGGRNNVVDGVAVEAPDFVYESGLPLLVIDHQTARRPQDLPALPEDDAALDAALTPFLFALCRAERNWNMKNFVADQVELLRRQIGDRKVLLALSGGVDSSVVAALLIKAVGNQLTSVHVNHGLMRKGESEEVIEVFRNGLGAELVYVDATDRFLDKLAGVADPEQKRKIIGAEFIRVFEEEA
ncbi:MAG: glutamine-hydrolyzing GMP synthase, partial [Clostridia bacterium]|nr:glutamine-hydrolyzing GMP synthase [Clostridia bacterium]